VLQFWARRLTRFRVTHDSRLAPRWYCDVVNGVKGCCRNGRTCESDNEDAVCTNDGYVPCTGGNFCCRKHFKVPLQIPALRTSPRFTHLVVAPDYVCYRDAAGSPKCRVPGVTSTRNASGSGFSSTPRPTSTSTVVRKTEFRL